MIDPLLQLTIALSLFLLFVSASQHKRAELRRFAAQLEAYELLPKRLNRIFAVSLPWLELAVGVLLLIPASRGFAGFTAAVLLTMYAFAVLVNLLRGRHNIDCGCGGTPQPLSYWLVLRNSVLVIGAALLTLPGTERTLHVSDAVAMVMMTLLLVCCYLCIGQLLQNQAAQQGWNSHVH
ncbi:MauE/DoxX family redox-associated membrane protein [Congregibacter variabilis]|uniref:Methylamine utilization protein MauE n=1 Tax=Congregibacter variabilis TaxID=3081200 RepID=A0ABZ0HZN9_9GAMM|nr:MauE/DoxX family redox-associated membrane protein [Congregibacter sp. IMCC43200]